MNEIIFGFIAFFSIVFSLFLMFIIGRLKKLKKIDGNLTNEGLVLSHTDDTVPEIAICGCLSAPCCIGFICGNCIAICFGESIINRREKRAHRQSDEVERRATERRKKEQEKYLTKIEQEKIERKGRLEALRTSGYIATEEDRYKVIELLRPNPKINLLWVSNAVKLPIEEIIIILENESDFEIKDEYIINKKMKSKIEFSTKEEAKVAAELEVEK